MQMRMKAMIIILMFALASLSAYSLEEYPNTGGTQEDFALGTGLWNNELDVGDYTSFTKTMTNPKFMPLVDDLDGDGTNEIVVFDNNQIKIFRNNILTVVDGVILPTADVYSPPIIFDVAATSPNPAIAASASLAPTIDSYILESLPTQNFGSSNSIISDRQAGVLSRPIIKFDLSSIPSNAVITSAQLRMNSTVEAGAVFTMEAHRITADWTENGITWNLRDGTNAWAAPGGDFDSAFTYTTANAPDGGVSESNFSITLLVQQWVDGTYNNYGVLLDEQATGASAIKTFTAREALTQYAPRLLINYTLPSSQGTARKEILVGSGRAAPSELRQVSIISYNGTGTSIQTITVKSTVSAGINIDEILLACANINDCIYLWSENTGTTQRTRVLGFNSTNSTSSFVDVRTSTVEKGCFPLIPAITISDVDSDGENEYVYSQLYTSNIATDTADDAIRIFILNKTNGAITKQSEFTAGNFNLIDVAKASCTTSTGLGAGDYPVGKYISSPLVYNFDGAINNGQEIILAFGVNPTEFVMHSFTSAGVFIDDYPESFEATGRIISNPMRFNAFPDRPKDSFCTLGYKQDSNSLDLLCANMLTGNIPQTEEFGFDNGLLENYTSSYQYYNAISHSVSDISTLTDGADLDELLATYGTFSLEWDTGFLGFSNSLLTQWVNPLQGGTLLQIDAQGVGRDDILALTPTNLWYFDDGFTNQNAEIDFYQVNPCIERTWELNTTVNVQVRAIDSESNNIQYRAILYDGDSNAQDSGYSAFFTSGTVASFTFTANKTIGIGTLALFAHDSEHLLTDDEIDIPFSVSTTGAELNDCTTIVNIDTAATSSNDTDTVLGTTPLDIQDNAVRNIVNDFNGLFKLGALGTFLFMLLAGNVWFLVEGRKHLGLHDNLRYTFAILMVIDVLAIVVGAITLIIPFGMIVFLAIIGLLVLAFFVKDKLGGGNGNSGG